ncbi:tail fiber domain-containing protein [Spirosoma koreense]
MTQPLLVVQSVQLYAKPSDSAPLGAGLASILALKRPINKSANWLGWLLMFGMLNSLGVQAQVTLKELNAPTVGVGLDSGKAFLNVISKRTVLFGVDSLGGTGRPTVTRFDKMGALQNGGFDPAYGANTAGNYRYQNQPIEPKMIWYGNKGAFRAGGVYTGQSRPNLANRPDIPYPYNKGQSQNSPYIVDLSLDIQRDYYDTLSFQRFWDNREFKSIASGGTRDVIGDFSFASGANTRASGQFSTAMGYQTQALGHFSTALGYKNWAVGDQSIVLGSQSAAGYKVASTKGTPDNSSNENGVSAGESDSEPAFAICVGNNSYALGLRSLVLGNNSFAKGSYNVAIGAGSATGNIDYLRDSFNPDAFDPRVDVYRPTGNGNFFDTPRFAFAFGYVARASGDYSMALGNKAQANGENSLAIGQSVQTNNTNAVAIGNSANAAGNSAFSIGNLTQASGPSSTALGNQAQASGQFSTAMGYQTQASGLNTMATGYLSIASGETSTAIGNQAQAIGVSTISLGTSTTATGNFATALGRQTLASGDNATALGYLTQASTDGTAMGTSTMAMARYSTAAGYLSRTNGRYSVAMGFDAQTGVAAGAAISMGQSTSAIGPGSVALGQSTLANGPNSVALGINSQTGPAAQAAISMGQSTSAIGANSVALGTATLASGPFSTAMGFTTQATAPYAMAMGFQSLASGAASSAQGFQAQATGENAIAIGYQVLASGKNSTAMGSSVSTNGKVGSFIIGDGRTNSRALNTEDNQMLMNFGGGYILRTDPANLPYANAGVALPPSGNAWTTLSDSTRKENFRPADGASFLKKIGQMRLGSWNYKGQDVRTLRHYGPMAQDFFAAFGHDALGTIGEDKAINQADFDGVNLIAIKALIQEVEQLKAANQQLKADNGQLRTQLETTRQQGQQVEDRLSRLEAALFTVPASPSVNAELTQKP